MAQTANLGLPLIDANMTADVPRDMNALAEAVDSALGNVKVPDASLTEKGIVQLSNATNSTAENLAATPKAVKAAHDLAASAETPAGAQARANAAETNAKNASVPRAGGVNMTGRLTMQQWGTYSANASGRALYGSNCYLEGSNFKYENTHANLGARGMIMAFQTGSEPQIFIFDTGLVATTAGATFTPTLKRVLNQSDYDALFTSVANGKQAIATAISGKGVPASGSDEFAVLASKISQISTGMKFANGGLGNSSYGTITNLPFTPKALFITVYAQKPGLSADGLAGVILQGSTVVFNGSISASSSSESINVGLTSLNFGSNSVSFSLTDSGAQARSYIVFGE